MWKLKDAAENFSKENNAKRMNQWLPDLKSAIKEIQKLEIGINYHKNHS